jgi:hypothetical protein
VLHIFGREAWLAEPTAVHFGLSIIMTPGMARVRLVAEWEEAGPKEIGGFYRGANGNTDERREFAFYPVGKGLFTRWETPNGGDCAIELSSPNPPARLEFRELAEPAVSMTAGVLPACLARTIPQMRGKPTGFDLVSLVTERLGDADLTGAIKLFAYSRSGIPETEVVAAAREVLAYLARYPLQRDPLLGAFLASLCAEAAAR